MPLELKITLSETGEFHVSGVIENKLVALGLLELAKDAIFKHHDAKQNRIVPAMLMPSLS